MTYRLNLVFFLFFAPGYAICSNGNILNTYEHLLDNYKTYSLARCITNNYKKMGIDFNKLPLKDYTMGFIDIEEGLAFSSDKNNALDMFIKSKTDNFYKTRQTEGDLAQLNMVIYDCVDFYHSTELNVFLNNLISKKTE
ncbi:hypothetical protein I5462_18700 [Citrobacter freundii]|uniref:hypothetical protein n=2 Tax=Citrobacter freundii TaxID=546 RepID=UPI001575703D|nr:hypothetical protein [Citrobacter freundii]ELT7645130.1 hypothetical protein [Citrobacter freundii]EMB4340339.1 hypothetical protein [Citrobacter freundii]MBJ9043090.1 hypothetical protein [Citrobacter freundii]NTY75067.1 hypothetical protein [Citrobacter freundii]NUA11514.1 hypothetical protein [Citrobacter freundii]